MATRHPMTTRSRINEREHPMLTRSLSRKHPQPKPQRRRRRNQVKRGVNKPFVSPLAEMSCLDLCWLGMSQTHVEPVRLETFGLSRDMSAPVERVPLELMSNDECRRGGYLRGF